MSILSLPEELIYVILEAGNLGVADGLAVSEVSSLGMYRDP